MTDTPAPSRVKWQPVKGDVRDRMRTEAAQDYNAGSSIRAVAAHLSERYGPVSFGLARDLLHEARVPMRSRNTRARRS
jgi:hypothetical protein